MKSKLMTSKVMGCCAAAALSAAPVAAQTVTASDGTTSHTYGNTSGFAIDFNSTAESAAVWSPALVAGQQYALDAIAIELGTSGSVTTPTTPEYLGVYTGFSSGTLSGFLGASQNAINFSTATTLTWLDFNFSGIDVTADSGTPLSGGSGELYFVYQEGTAAQTGENGADQVPTIRFGAGAATDTTDSLSDIIAYGGLAGSRAPQYEASLTAVPEPSTMALSVLSGMACLGFFRRLKK
jgi:hypothetical protein